jgi:hypothetical protein
MEDFNFDPMLSSPTADYYESLEPYLIFNKTSDAEYIPTTVAEMSDDSSFENNTYADLQVLNNSASILLDDIVGDIGNLSPKSVEQVFASLEPKEFKKVYDVIDNHTFNQIAEKMKVVPPKNYSDRIQFLSRNHEHIFVVKYDIPSYFPDTVILQIVLDKAPDEIQCNRGLLECTNQHHPKTVIFSCQGINYPMHGIPQLTLDKKASELPVKMRFFCNSTCTSMYPKTTVKFRLLDEYGKVYKEVAVNIKISERPDRDRKVWLKSEKSQKFVFNENNEIKLEDGFVENLVEIKKQLPRLDYFNRFPGFDIKLGDNKKSSGNEFYTRIGEPIKFNFGYDPTMYSSEPLFIKAMVVDQRNLMKTFALCDKHLTSDNNLQIMRCVSTDVNVNYVGNPNGYYDRDRLAIVLSINNNVSLLPGPRISTFALKFLCNNSCFYADKKDTKTTLILTLENADHVVYARRIFVFKVVERPSRCKFSTSAIKRSNKTQSKSEPLEKRAKFFIHEVS